MEYRSHKVRIENLPKEKPIYNVGTKSLSVIIVGWGLTAALLTSKNYWYLAVPAGVFSAMQTFKKDRKIFEGFANRFVVYLLDDSVYCEQYYHSEIIEWESRMSNGNTYISLTMKDGEKKKIERGCDRGMCLYFHRCLPEKERRPKK